MTDNAPYTDEPGGTTPAPSGYEKKCPYPWVPPAVPKIPERGKCPEPCECPTPPGGTPSNCLDDLIRSQNIIVKKADRAKEFAKELTDIQGKVVSAQADYTQARFLDLRKRWKEQDAAIVELISKLVCAVSCWECLLWCRLCTQLGDIRTLEDRLDGTGTLTKKVHSLRDLQAWHERNVANMETRVERIKKVLVAWEKPSEALSDVLDKNSDLIKVTKDGTDQAKTVYDVFMTLIPRHWAIQPRDEGSSGEWKSKIDPKYINICQCKPSPQKNDDNSRTKGRDKPENKDDDCDETPKPPECQCDEGTPDACCGPDVGILSLRQRLVGPLPYLVDPAKFPDIICCLATARLKPASEHLAAAQADLEATKAEIDLVKDRISKKTENIEATFLAELKTPVCCDDKSKYRPKEDCPPPKPPDDGYGGAKQPQQTAR